jgi:hypothetical protein
MSPVRNKFADLPKVAKLERGREWVYFLRAECESHLVKIGHSINLKWRLTGLQTMCPVQLSLVGLAQGPAGAEYVFHEALSASRAHGEWFNPTPELEAIRKALPKAGVIETPDLVRLVEPLGVSEDRVQQVLVWALSQAKHSDDDGGVEIRPSNINYLIETHRPGKRDWVQIRERHENGEPFRTPGRRA